MRRIVIESFGFGVEAKKAAWAYAIKCGLEIVKHDAQSRIRVRARKMDGAWAVVAEDFTDSLPTPPLGSSTHR